jgi:transcriptional regulator with XRE-family HTH domain
MIERLSDSPPPQSLGERIVSKRQDLGLTQEQLAFSTGISQGFCANLEIDDIQGINYKSALNIVKALGAGINLFEGVQDDRVFLMPPARRLHELLSQTKLGNLKALEIENLTLKLIPEVETKNVRYIHEISNKEPIGESIKRRRGEISQTELAVRSGISQGFISLVESGKSIPSITYVRKIAFGLTIDAHELLDIEEINYPSAIIHFDRFLRSTKFTAGQKNVYLNRLSQMVSMIQPLANSIDPIPQSVYII